jgi:hypothetical protein
MLFVGETPSENSRDGGAGGRRYLYKLRTVFEAGVEFTGGEPSVTLSKHAK